MRSRTSVSALLMLGAALLVLWVLVAPVRAATLPADFSDSLVTSVADPTALAWTPDGRMLIASRDGQLRVFRQGSLLPAPALDISGRLCTNSERGLLGVAVHPQFANNRYIYLYYTFNKHNTCPQGQPTNANNPVNRVSRFVLGDNNVIDAASETVLIDNIVSANGNHNAGDLQFGKDGLLYISVGDGGCDYAGNSGCAGSNDAAREQHTLLGKILRITDNGDIPETNPYRGSDSARCNANGRTDPGKKCQETYAWGLRNPFRIAFDPNAAGTRFLINDVGQNRWEEIDEGAAGADYGWNGREGFCANGSTSDCRRTPGAVVDGKTDPIHAYGRDVGYSITGGAFVPNGVWAAAYDNDYLFADYGGKIMRLERNSDGSYTRSNFVTGLGSSSVVTMSFGPYNGTQALYYTTYNGGQVRRISYAGSTNRAPTAALSADPVAGAAPLLVNFNGASSSDPDGDALIYRWDFGDGSVPTETSGATISHTYTITGTYTASLTVRDSRGAVSAVATVRIDVGNTPPAASIVVPTIDHQFTVGETITLQGSANDAQDGPLPADALTWKVLLHHAEHVHPLLPPTTGNNITITAPAPEDLLAATNSYLEIELTATDGQGLSTTITQDLLPKKVEITFNTQPSGLTLEVNGTSISGPTTITSWQGYNLNVNAPDQISNGVAYTFAAWSDGGAQAHTITTGASAASYTATFNGSGGGGTGLRGEYFDNVDFTDLQTTRTDATIDFDWGMSTPSGTALTDGDTWSVRWTGSIEAPVSGSYTFTTTSDDGVRLWVCDTLIINNWTDHAARDDSGTIDLVGGQKCAIRLEFYDNARNAVMKLWWAYRGQRQQIVPQGRLYLP